MDKKNIFLHIFLVFIPALIIYFFLSPDIYKKEIIPYYFLFLIALAYLIVFFFSALFFILIKVLKLNFLNYSLTIAICFFLIIISYPLTLKNERILILIRILLIFLSTFSFIPIFLITKYIEQRKRK
ncbi:MAG3450 family membrane protein [[Mycoplasma] collis]|uniref:MAG3450 family membrane protein n=1 Tax=[Mycoplasma] collis TaxID=2127 RepID=UPI00051B9CE7